MARQMTVQAVYEWQMTGKSAQEIIQQFIEDDKKKRADLDYFSEMVAGIIAHAADIDQVLARYITGRTIDELDQVDRSILRTGCYELLYHRELDYKIAINEAIELAKLFAAADSHKFVNGVLDKVVKNEL
ncbi:MAG: transcription antitermination factor NusB [Succinivibrionaceae bacterium]|nr:transcription antitermination factor NusB [Succinivibrionaceae bacterium]